jgi:hypothetical protein
MHAGRRATRGGVLASVAEKAGLEGDRSADALVRLLYSWKAAKPATTMETSLLVTQTNPPTMIPASPAGYLFVMESAWIVVTKRGNGFGGSAGRRLDNVCLEGQPLQSLLWQMDL